MLAFFCFIIGSINSIYYVAYDSFYPLLISEGNYSGLLHRERAGDALGAHHPDRNVLL